MGRYLPGTAGDGLALATAVACGVFIGRFMMARQEGRPRARPERARLQPRRERLALPCPQPGPRPQERPGGAGTHRGPRYARSRAEAGQWQPAVAPWPDGRSLAGEQGPLRLAEGEQRLW